MFLLYTDTYWLPVGIRCHGYLMASVNDPAVETSTKVKQEWYLLFILERSNKGNYGKLHTIGLKVNKSF